MLNKTIECFSNHEGHEELEGKNKKQKEKQSKIKKTTGTFTRHVRRNIKTFECHCEGV